MNSPPTKPDAQLYLNVPYEQKWRAKELGARWDSEIRMWYVPYGFNVNEFKKWWPKTLASRTEALRNPKTNSAKSPKAAKQKKRHERKEANSIDPQWKRDLQHAAKMTALIKST